MPPSSSSSPSSFLARDQWMKLVLTVIASLLVVQYSFNVIMTHKYVSMRQYTSNNGGGNRSGTAAASSSSWLWSSSSSSSSPVINSDGNGGGRGGGGGILRWLLSAHNEDVMPSTTPTPPPPCPDVPPELMNRNRSTNGIIPVLFNKPSWDDLAAMLPDLLPGGEWKPDNCSARSHIAIVIPFRDRDSHLRIFLNHMHPFLQRQQLHYSIVVVEQFGEDLFSRSMLMNIGFVEAMKIDNSIECFFFHDVDLLPENDFNLYRCPESPRHMSAAVDVLGYKLPYGTIFGGVSALTTAQFREVNGFSNIFFGWGGEDDDLYNRIHHHGYKLLRYPMQVARYRMVRHVKNQPSTDRMKNLHSGSQRFAIDGINSLTYDLVNVTKLRTYTRVQVYINRTLVLRQNEKRLRAEIMRRQKQLLTMNRTALLKGPASNTAENNARWAGALNSLGQVLDHVPKSETKTETKTNNRADTKTETETKTKSKMDETKTETKFEAMDDNENEIENGDELDDELPDWEQNEIHRNPVLKSKDLHVKTKMELNQNIFTGEKHKQKLIAALKPEKSETTYQRLPARTRVDTKRLVENSKKPLNAEADEGINTELKNKNSTISKNVQDAYRRTALNRGNKLRIYRRARYVRDKRNKQIDISPVKVNNYDIDEELRRLKNARKEKLT